MLKEIGKQFLRFKEKLCKKPKKKYHKSKQPLEYLASKDNQVINNEKLKIFCYYLYIYYFSNILMNIILILENYEYFLSNTLPNLIYSSVLILIIGFIQLKSQNICLRNKRKRIKEFILGLILIETLFFIHTRFFIGITQKPDRIYFKVLFFYFHIMIITSMLKTLDRLYSLIFVTGYILLNIWIYENYDIFTVIYDFLNYFAIIFMFLLYSLIIIGKNQKKTIKTKKNIAMSNIVEKNKISLDIANSIKKTMEMEENFWIEIINQTEEGVIIMRPDYKIKFVNKRVQNIANMLDSKSNQIFNQNLENHENSIFKILNQRKFIKKPENFMENSNNNDEILEFSDILTKFCSENKSPKEKTVYKTSSNSEKISFDLKLLSITYIQDECVMVLIFNIKKQKNKPDKKEQLKLIKNQTDFINTQKLQIEDMKQKIELLKNSSFQDNLVFSKLIRKPFKNHFNSCLPLFEYCFSEKGELQKNVLEFIYFNLKTIETKVNNLSDFFSLKAKKFFLTFQSLHLKTFISEIYQTFFPLAKSKNLDFVIFIDEKTPDFFMTDFTRLSQILFTLLTNSFKFTITGYVKLFITPFQINGQIILQILIQDSGIGFSKKYYENLINILKNINSENFNLDEQEVSSLIISHILALELGIEPSGLGLKVDSFENIGTRILFYVLDKSIQKNKNLPSLEIQADIKNYSGFKEILKSSVMKNSISCIESTDTPRYFSRKFLIENNYKFLDNLESKNKDVSLKNGKNCNCYDILIIDEDYFDVFVIDLILTGRQFKCKKAINVKEAMEYLMEGCMKDKCLFCKGYQLIIINFDSLTKNDRETPKYLNEIMNKENIPMINIIGLIENDAQFEISSCIELGMKDILMKPIMKENLYSIIHKWI